MSNFLGQLDTERVYSVIYLSAPSPANLAKLRAQEAATGHVTAALRAALTSGSTLSNAPSGVRQASATLLQDAAGLPALHASIGAQGVSRAQALATYNKLINDSYLLLNKVILTETSTPIAAQALALERIAKSAELLQQENVLVVSDLAGRRFPPADRQAFTKLAGARATLYAQTLPELDPSYRAIYQTDVRPAAYAGLTRLENTVIGAHHPRWPPPVAPADWGGAVQGVSLGLERAGTQAASALDQQAEHEARVTDLRLLLSGGLGLLAVILSIIVSLLAGRGLVRELQGLRRSALDLADHRLPQMVDQLATGHDVKMDEDDSLDAPIHTREIAQVRDAFTKVQRTAVDAAVGQARLREGIGQVFRNLARRSQSLLHRQLALLDRMERRTEDPQELGDLFRLDHLTTRMRRHAESLIILSGQSPARGWRNPVPFVDVIRAAVAEVEDYTRVSVMSADDTGLAGPAVGDVIHMTAELIENATIYSPPNTPVVIQGGIVGQGFAIEIEDRGLGMSDEKLAEANEQLAEPLPFDPANTDQLGLLVAGQLARRHDIRITLRRNPYGGTTAIVLIPHSIVVAQGFGELEPVKALESAPDSAPTGIGIPGTGDQNGFAVSEDTEPDLSHEGMPGERGEPAGAGRQEPGLQSYQPAPPAPAAPPAPQLQAPPPPAPPPPAPAPPMPAPPMPAPPMSAPPMPAPPPAAAPSLAGNQAPPWAEPDPNTWAEAESRAWTGMESPAWSQPPRPAAGTPTADAPAEGDIGPGDTGQDDMGPDDTGQADMGPDDTGQADMGQPVLPRRVRQASLVPQLRNAPPAYPPLPGRYGDPRPPDEARATVSAIQDGWERGRSMFDPAPAPPAGAGAPEAGAPEAGAPEAGESEAGEPEADESGTANDEGGRYGAYQQETPIEDRGPHGPG
ncbi:MAG TPA: nitrate- and nitrite sensing domain-containing protein [Streptosporangiaceae bacterium]|nr:nitrate- and nitrite sensing domain-containing protein [Streptosporangiaceae bacterium]